MKKLLISLIMLFGLILCAFPAFTDSTETAALSGKLSVESQVNNATACPGCSGTAPVVSGVTFQAGTDCTCSGATSLTIGPNVTVKKGASVTFQSTKINIKSGTTFEQGSIVNMLWIKEPVTIGLAADPTSIAANGSSHSIITGAFKDGIGNPVPKGTSTTFTTTLGAFTNGVKTYTIQTYDDTGIVTVFLYSGTTAGTATVEATLGATTSQVQVTIYSKAPAGVVLQADPISLNADGASTSEIRASVTDATGSPVLDGTSIAFSMTTGTGSLSAASATTIGGVATVTYTASMTAGTETVKAEASNGASDTFDVTLLGTPDPADFALSTSRTTIKSDDSEAATITATVVDGNNASFSGALVSFSADSGKIKLPSAVITDENGQASVEISSGTINKSNRVITITATVSNLGSEIIPVQVVGSTLTTATDKSTITDDNTTVAELTITARDAREVAVYNTQIVFSFGQADTGTAAITPVNPATYPYTDVNGQLKVIVTGLTAGSVTVIASGLGTTSSQGYTVSAVGTEFAILAPASDPFNTHIRHVSTLAITPNNISIAFVNSNPDTITRSDGNSFIVDGFSAGDSIMVGGSTDNDGVYTVATVSAGTLTLVAGDSLATEGVGSTVTITNGVLVRVRAFDQTNVSFSTTIGVWNGGNSAVATIAVPASGYVWSVLTANTAGSATVQVYDADKTATSDSTTVAFSAPSADAAMLNLQANTYVVAPSTGDTKNTATLTATVRAAGGQVVGGAAIAFSVVNPTGGGEIVSPVVAITNSSGIAQATFTSGALSTDALGVEIAATVLGKGKTDSNSTIAFFNTNPDAITRSDAGGSFVTDGFKAGQKIRVKGSLFNDGDYIISSVAALSLTLDGQESLNAEVAGKSITITAATDSVHIVIGGTAGSVVIGRGTTINEIDPATYGLPMSVLVADSNGNPVSGALVSLSAWPLQYSAGVWYDRDDSYLDNYQTYITGTFANEDANENMILDPGEDANGDGELTPPNSAAGDVPTTVTTDANGVANFNLIFLKSSSHWIVDRIRASTFVLGTEITSSLTFRLPANIAEATSGVLPDSPYPIGLVTGTKTSKSFVFPQFGNQNEDNFSTTNPLSKGHSSMGVDSQDHEYTYNPTGGTPASVGNVIWDYITATGYYYDFAVPETIRAYFPVRIIITYADPIEPTVSVAASTAEITADGVSTTNITASATDTDGQAVPDGTIVSFATTSGTLSAATAPTTGGKATVTLTSSTTAGTATVTANYSTVSSSTAVKFMAGAVASVTVSANPVTVEADGVSTSAIAATARDVNNNLVSGETITFTVVSGTLSAGTSTTVDGVAKVTYISPSTVPVGGTDTVTATSTNATSGTKNITITAVPVGSVNISAGSNTIHADGLDSTVIRVTIRSINNQLMPDGTTVTLTTTAGTLSSAAATTVNGVATVYLTSATSLGIATIKATCGGVNASTTVTFVAGPVANIAGKALPDNLSADGISTSTIRITATDANNNVVNGTTINCTVVSGILSAASVLTDSNGVATVTYTAPYSVPVGGTDTVTLTSTNGTTGTAIITIIAANVGSVTLSIGSSSLVANGISGSLITVEVRDSKNNLVANGTTVNFATTAGTLSSATATTVNGVATVTLTSPTVVGSATVTATCGGVNDTGTVNFVAGSVNAVATLANPNNLTADGTSTSTITATATDTNGNPAAGESISFTVVSGKLSAASAVTDANGIATVTYIAPNSVPVGGTDTVTATSTNGTSGTETISLIAALVGSVNVTAGSSSIGAGGAGTLISAEVADTNGNPVEDGTTVNFSTTSGTLSGASSTTVNGVAWVTLTSPAIIGTATVTATCGGVNDTATVSFVAGEIDSVSVNAQPNNLSADGTTASTIKATALDVNGNPVPGETISFTVLSGSLSAASAVTNASGVATVIYTAPFAVPVGNMDTVTATSTNGETGTANITIIPNTIGSISVAGEDTEILVDDGTDKSTTEILATVKDSGGQPVPDGTIVNFETTAGTLSGATATTTDGVATIVLTASTARGDAVVSATCGGLVAQTGVTFLAGEPGTINIKATPNSVPFATNGSSTITVEVFDSNGNPVENGTTLNFTVTLGVLNNLVAATTNGLASVSYTAPGPLPALGPASDTVTVTATNGITATVTIDNADN